MKKIQIFNLGLFFSLIFICSCEKNEDPSDQEQDGYKLSEHLIETADPCFINIMFQVSDMNNKGVSTLVTEDFEVQEDNQAVSPTESAMSIKKKDAIDYKLKTVLMLDNSTSVGDNIDDIKNAALALANNITLKQEIAVYVFSEDPVLLQDFTSDLTLLTNAINSISLGYATTNLYGSVSFGIGRWEDYYSTEGIEQGFMILITDGSDTQGSSSLSSTLNSIGDKKVYAVGLGSEQDMEALEQLGTTGYYSLKDYSELSVKFSEIQDEISTYANSFYWLYYMSPKRGDNYHTLKLFIKENSNTSYNSNIEGEFNSNGFYSVEQGVVVNGGINNLEINLGDTYQLSATTYLPQNAPSYTWQSNNASIISVSVDQANNANATIEALGIDGQSANITVTDNTNSLSKTVVISIIESPNGHFTDKRDGRTYKTVKIGSQVWLAENLNYKTASGSWIYDNNSSNASIYGSLYDWETAQNVCPSGWHLPSDDEWKQLEMTIGMSQGAADDIGWRGTDEGSKLKATSGWFNNGNGTDEYGFTALPGGYGTPDGDFHNISDFGFWWSATEEDTNSAWFRLIICDKSNLNRNTSISKEDRFSVRCLRDD